MAAVVIAKTAIAVAAAAIASRPALGRFPADKSHEHEAGGEEQNDPADCVRGDGHGARSCWTWLECMIPKSEKRFSEKIMLQRDI
jgi:hypothetical protein